MDTVLIFAGGDSPADSLVEEIPSADLIVAADGGYDLAIGQGYAVDVLIGDLDSIETDAVPSNVIVERHPAGKDATDLELALDRVVVERPQRVVVIGGAGGRVDHELAAAALLCSGKWREIDEIDWITERGWGYVIRDRRIIHGDVGATLSLIPMGGDATGVRTRGLRWDLTNETLHHGTTRGVSNVFAGPVADIRLSLGCLLAMIPRS
ncbi:MAG TPA: thiamine diphosphokinase [Acidimicrobiia bacterium]|jgi:thiamine pyrophosphokinase